MTRRAHRLLAGHRPVDLKARPAMRTSHRQQHRRAGPAPAGPILFEPARRLRAALQPSIQPVEHAPPLRPAKVETFQILKARFAADIRAKRIDRNCHYAMTCRAHRLAARHRRIDLKHAVAVRTSKLQHRRSPIVRRTESVTPPHRTGHDHLRKSPTTFYYCPVPSLPTQLPTWSRPCRLDSTRLPTDPPQLAGATPSKLRYSRRHTTSKPGHSHAEHPIDVGYA